MITTSKKIILLSLAIFSFGFHSFAQTEAFDLSDILYMSLVPSSPRPGQTVTATVGLSTNAKLDGFTISWYLDGVIKKEGTGEKKFTFDVNKEGRTETIKVIVSNTDNRGEFLEKISPTEIDLIVEADGFMMPFYRGKVPFISQGTVRIVAISNIMKDGKKVSEKNLIFKWKNNNKVLANASGVGKDVLTIAGSIPSKDVSAELEVSTIDGSIKAVRSVYVSTSNPSILFYENSPLLGTLFNKALVGTYDLGSTEEVSVEAFPLGFSVKNKLDSSLKYSWSVNNTSAVLDGEPNIMVLRQASAGRGSADVSLELKNQKQIFQFSNGSFGIIYGE